MITLRLFKAEDPFVQVAERTLLGGEICVGRDPSSEWTIPDSRGDLSRRHCIFGTDGQRFWLRDTSSNGVFIGRDRVRAPRAEMLELAPGDTVFLGEFIILLDGRTEDGQRDELSAREVPIFQPACSSAPNVSSAASMTDAGMLEAFCRGARLEASSLAGEDPAALMNRLGLVYRQAVDDLCGLMGDRADLKDNLKLDRTTISARDNNPLKWAPPERVAIDLLREGETGFLKGAAAFKASFLDLRRHGACMAAASREAVKAILAELSPQQFEAVAPRQPFGFLSRNEGAWRQFQMRHAELAAEAAAGKSDSVDRAFRVGYAAHAQALEIEGEAA